MKIFAHEARSTDVAPAFIKSVSISNRAEKTCNPNGASQAKRFKAMAIDKMLEKQLETENKFNSHAKPKVGKAER